VRSKPVAAFRLNMNHGLFEVVPGVYQVARVLDSAKMTLRRASAACIVVDPLTSIDARRRRSSISAPRGRTAGGRWHLYPHP